MGSPIEDFLANSRHIREAMAGAEHIRELASNAEQIQSMMEGPEYLREAIAGSEHMRELAEGSEQVCEAIAGSEHIRELAAGGNQIRSMMEGSEHLREAIAGSEHLRELEASTQQMRDMMAGAEHMRELAAGAEQMRSMIAGLGEFLTVQQAASRMLQQAARPMTSRELAERALELNLVHSSARDPVHSFAQTLEKNIRENIYNDPPLKFVHRGGKRLIAAQDAAEVEDLADKSKPTSPSRVTLDLPDTLARAASLAVQAGLASSMPDAIVLLAHKGLRALGPEIKRLIAQQLEQLEGDSSEEDLV